MQKIPWLFSAITALVFGILAHKKGRLWFPWAFGGGLFALVISTWVMGLCQAVFIPYSHQFSVDFRIKEILITLLAVAIPGWFLTSGLHHQPLFLWRAITGKLHKTENPGKK